MAEWISYETADEPASEVSIDVDFDQDPEFRGQHPFAILVQVRGFNADADGEPLPAQADALYNLEDSVERVLTQNNGALVLTISAPASFTLAGYAADAGAEDALRSLATSTVFGVEVHSEPDPQWAHYDANILRGEELEQARDEAQIDQMFEAGGDPEALYDVDFALEFSGHDSAVASFDALTNAGYSVTAPFEGETNVSALRTMRLDADALQSARVQLQAIIAPHGGHYGGWGAESIDQID